MKDSYEAKIEVLQHEVRAIQKLRMESSQRLRADLDDERKRNQHVVSVCCFCGCCARFFECC